MWRNITILRGAQGAAQTSGLLLPSGADPEHNFLPLLLQLCLFCPPLRFPRVRSHLDVGHHLRAFEEQLGQPL